MKKIILSVGFLLVIGLFNSAYAFTLETVEENESTVTYDLLANPPEQSSGIQLRATLTGGVITTIDSGDSQKFLAFGVCQDGNSYTETEICIDYGLIGTYESVESGDLLLSVTIEKEPGEEVLLLPTNNYGYLNFEGLVINEGGEVIEDMSTNNQEGGSYVFMEPAVEENEERSSLPLFILIGVLVTLVIAFVVVMIVSNKKEVVTVKSEGV